MVVTVRVVPRVAFCVPEHAVAAVRRGVPARPNDVRHRVFGCDFQIERVADQSGVPARRLYDYEWGCAAVFACELAAVLEWGVCVSLSVLWSVCLSRFETFESFTSIT